mgnify:CR=1 FL=1
MTGIVFAAHGSKKERSNREVLDLVELLNKEKAPGTAPIKAAFLEFAHPDIEQAVKEMIDAHCTHIDIYPFFLNTGKHVSIDIPQTVEQLRKCYPAVTVTILSHFGASSKLAKIILDDLEVMA